MDNPAFSRPGGARELAQNIQALIDSPRDNPLVEPDDVRKAAEDIRSLESTFNATGETVYLNAAIALAEMLVEGGTGAVVGAYLLPFLLKKRYDMAGALEDLGLAIKVAKESLSATHLDHTVRVDVVYNLGRIFYMMYKRLGALEDLDQAINWTGQAVAETLSDGPERGTRLSSLGMLHKLKFQHLGAMGDLERAITLAEQGLAETSPGDSDRGACLSNLGVFYHLKFERLGVMSDLEQAINWTEQAVAETLPDDSDRRNCLFNLGVFYKLRFQRLGAMGDLEQAINWTEQVVAETSPDDSDRAARLYSLGMLYNLKFQRLGAMGDLERAINWTEQAVAETSPGDSDRASRLSNLGLIYDLKFQRLGAMGDLEQAITLTEKGLAETSPDDPDRGACLSNLGVFYYRKFQRLGVIGDLEQAINWTEQVVAGAPPGDSDQAMEDLEQSMRQNEEVVASFSPGEPDRASSLRNLGKYYHSRYEQLGALGDLDKAITLTEQAVEKTSPDNSNREANLGVFYTLRFERLGAMEDLEQSIKWDEEMIKGSSPGEPDRAHRLGSLGTSYHIRYERLGVPKNLDQAISWFKQAVAETSPDESSRGGHLSNLGLIYRLRFELVGTDEDLEQAIKCGEEGVTCSSPGETGRVVTLGGSYHSRYVRFGALGDLDKAINCIEQAVAAMPPDSSGRPTASSDLSVLLQSRYHRLGSMQDLNRAINIGEDAVTTAPYDDPDRWDCLCNLGGAFMYRYMRAKALRDLELAIHWTTLAVATTPPNSPKPRFPLYNLASLFHNKYNRLGDPSDLEKSITCAEEALAATPSKHLFRPSVFYSLSMYLFSRHKRLNGLQGFEGEALEGLERAIGTCKEAVVATPSDHPDRSAYLDGLGHLIHTRHERLGDVRDLEWAISLSEEAVAATPPDDPRRGERLFKLATYICTRCYNNVPSSAEDRDWAISLLREAWQCTMSPPSIRIRAAHNAAMNLAVQRRWKESTFLFEGAMRELSKLSPRSLERGDQQHVLSDFSTQLVGIAISVALQAGGLGEAPHCLQLLELGRGIITGLTIDCRSDLSELQVQHPQAFDKFNRLRVEIDCPPVEIGTEYNGSTDQQRRRQREQAVDEFEKTLDYIRQLSGFEQFLLPLRPEYLMAMAGEGPIIIINSTLYRSDAIIVTNSVIKALRLQGLAYQEVDKWMKRLPRLLRGGPKTFPSRNEEMDRFLLWLWDAAVEPILGELNFNAVKDISNLTRIWWIGIGPLAMAPFHAAGDHSSGSTRNTISRAISSYIPTIKALSYARERSLELLDKQDSRLLLVNMPTTPGKRALKNAAMEVEGITGVIEGKAIPTRLDSPSSNKVLECLPSYHVAHFACHGVSDRRDPSNSHLLLFKDENTIDMLTVRAIWNANIKNVQIAYLSACCTADNPSVGLANESIHIASGFQVAGFSHVLATLWESNDSACRQVAVDFYRILFDGHGDGHRKVSTSFQHAVKKLRDQYPRQPLIWASFIHTGA